jgi:hypothetical protein
MLQKLIADRLITLPPFPQEAAPQPPMGLPAHFVPALEQNYYIKESTGVGWFNWTRSSQMVKSSTLGKNVPIKPHRTFRWLPWVPGKVTFMPLAGSDILTGPMTGCWLAIFRYNGVQYAGHIGTHLDANTPLTIQARDAWRNAVTNRDIFPVAAFKPTEDLPPESALNIKGQAAAFYGAFERTKAWTVVLTHSKGWPPDLRRIAHVLPRRTTPDVAAF